MVRPNRLRSAARPKVAAALVAAGLAGVAPRAGAQDAPSLNLRGFTPAPDPRATLFLEPVATPGPGVFHAAAWFSYANRPLVLRDANDEIVGKALEHQIVYDQTLGIGIGQRFGLGLALPVVLFQQSEEVAPVLALYGGRLPPGQALGDLTLAGKYALIPSGEIGGFGLGLVGRLTLPTGSRRGTLGEGAVTGEARLLAELGVAAFTLQGSAGLKVRPIERTFGGNTWGQELPWGAGLLIKPQLFGVDPKGRWTVGLETHGALPLAPDAPFSNAAITPAYAGGTLRFAPSALHLLFGAEAALSQAAGASPLRAVVQIGFVPRSHDKDQDGVDDEVDDCAGLAEDRDGFQDSDGCPEMDNDDDGVLDPDDRCPTKKEDIDGDRDEDGCPEEGPKAPDKKGPAPAPDKKGPPPPDKKGPPPPDTTAPAKPPQATPDPEPPKPDAAEPGTKPPPKGKKKKKAPPPPKKKKRK
ncbi:MAG TPA: hypothetical protein VFS00_31785 [Polyangiaceae bacterium]|nr:hypothetical protein [Polyangiaceae bacterium]